MTYRILHVLDHSWPVLDGYSQRSQSIVTAQLQLGMAPAVVTSPLHQADDPGALDTTLNGVQYFRTPDHPGLAGRAIRNRWPLLRELSVVRLLRRRIESILDSCALDVVHAHSPALCGLAALQAARSRGLPFVYEIRSFWEESAVDQKRTLRSSVRYALARHLETYVVRRADSLVGIANSILQELATRKVPAERLFHVPNGVDVARFTPRPRDAALAHELGIQDTPTLGYIGTLFLWEGVSWLVRAAVELRKSGTEFQLLIVGDGPDADHVRKAIEETNAAGFVRFLGRVPHSEIERYYSVMDVLVYPRRSMRLTELVTPLKPLEAMALKKATLGSSVGGLRELIESETTGLLFEPGNLADFCRQATRLLQQPDLRRALGENASRKIAAEKDWKVLAGRYEEVYATAIRNVQVRT
jgi:PEP-CTERM/exosortase A-associated glycosyltransferase